MMNFYVPVKININASDFLVYCVVLGNRFGNSMKNKAYC